MKKFFAMAILAVTALTASAQQQTVTFGAGCVQNGVPTLPDGWGIVEGSTLFTASSNGLYGSWQGGTSTLLVSPVLDGAMSVEYRCLEGDEYSSYGGEIYLYEMTPNGDGTYVKGSQLTRLFNNSWNTVSKEVAEGKCIGMQIDDAWVRKVTYTPASMDTDGRRLTLSNMTWTEGSTPLVSDYEGNVPFSFSINVNNTGGEDIAAGDPEAKLTFGCTGVANLMEFTLPEALAVGENKTFTFSGSFPISEIAAVTDMTTDRGYYWVQFQVKEPYFNQTAKISGWNEVYPRGFLFDTRVGQTVTNNLSFGFASPGQTVTKSIILYNKGVEELENVIVTLPEGFYLTDNAPFTVAPCTESVHSHTIEVNMGVREGEDPISGVLSGDMMIYVGGAEEPAVVHLAGAVADEDHYFEGFEAESYPAGWIIDPQLKIFTVPTYMQSEGNIRVLNNSSSMTSSIASAITPKLTAEAGEHLIFMAGAANIASYSDPAIYVSYSTDRVNWTPMKTIRSAVKAQEGDEKFSTTALGSYSSDSEMYIYDIAMPEGDGYLKFDILYARIDNLFGCQLTPVDHDMMIENVKVPALGNINNPVNFSFDVNNIAVNPEVAGTYTLHLFVNGQEAVTMTETPEIACGVNPFVMSYYPHETGDIAMKAELRAGDYVLATPEKVVPVYPETLSSEKVTGDTDADDATEWITSNTGGGNNYYYKNSMTQMLFTEDYLAKYGITPGMSLTGFHFIGYCTDTSKPLIRNVKAWMLPTVLEALDKNAPVGKGESDWTITLPEENLMLTLTDYVAVNGGSADDVKNVVNCDFPTPYVYNGGNLLLVVETTDGSEYSSSYYFKVDKKITNRCIQKRTDTPAQYPTLNSWTALANFPKIAFHVAVEPATFSGSVQDSETHAAIADAEITLTSGQVIYNGTSAEDGTFSIEVFQKDKEYAVSVSKANYNEYTGEADFTDGNIVENIELVSEIGDGVKSLTTDGISVSVQRDMIAVSAEGTLTIYGANGAMAARTRGNAISTRNLSAGVYILKVATAEGETTVRFIKK